MNWNPLRKRQQIKDENMHLTNQLDKHQETLALALRREIATFLFYFYPNDLKKLYLELEKFECASLRKDDKQITKDRLELIRFGILDDPLEGNHDFGGVFTSCYKDLGFAFELRYCTNELREELGAIDYKLLDRYRKLSQFLILRNIFNHRHQYDPLYVGKMVDLNSALKVLADIELADILDKVIEKFDLWKHFFQKPREGGEVFNYDHCEVKCISTMIYDAILGRDVERHQIHISYETMHGKQFGICIKNNGRKFYYRSDVDFLVTEEINPDREELRLISANINMPNLVPRKVL